MKAKKHFVLFLISAFVLTFTACSGNNQGENGETDYTPVYDANATSDALPSHTRVTFEVENYGKFVIETYPEHAPETVSNFLALVEGGLYNGFKIEKVTQSKTILTSEISSSISADSAAGQYNTVSGEFAKNGRSNTLKLDKYTIALNHIPDEYDSGKAQLMIFLSSNHDMDGSYAGFAKIVEGTEVIDKIAGVEVDRNETPVSPIVMKKVYINE